MGEFKEKNNTESLSENILDIEDPQEAKEIIAAAIEKGNLPIISVPEKYFDELKNGIRANTTWIGEKIIAGTILRDPYIPPGEVRRIFKINVSPDQVEPRFTGPDVHFHGVVAFRGPIPPEAIQEIYA